MTRALIDYREQRTAVGEGFDPDTPIEGFYSTQLRFGGVHVGIRIWYGPPNDPVTGEEMDRSWRWQALCNGEPISLERVWPKCADRPIEKAEYDHFSALQSWGQANNVAGVGDPTKPLNPLQSPMMF
ncbi:MAG: hypothetical protein V4530_06230 [Pseudomonadota bacterium]